MNNTAVVNGGGGAADDVWYLLLTGEALTLHGVLIVDRELVQELPAPLQGAAGPRDRTPALWEELHVLHRLRGVLMNTFDFLLKTVFKVSNNVWKHKPRLFFYGQTVALKALSISILKITSDSGLVLDPDKIKSAVCSAENPKYCAKKQCSSAKTTFFSLDKIFFKKVV